MIHKAKTGFSLLELLIVIATIGILCAFSIPIYSQHVTHTRRLEAEMSLFKLASALEKHHLLYGTYQSATLQNLGFTKIIADNFYELQIITANETGYLITAKPLAKQATTDSLCNHLLLDSQGTKNITGTGSLTACWT